MLNFKLRIEVASVENDKVRKLYLIGCETEEQLNKLKSHALDIFYDHVIEKIIVEENEISGDIVQVTYLPGVTDNVARSAREALALIGIKAEVFSGHVYLNCFSEEMANPLIQNITKFDKLTNDRFHQIELPLVNLDHELKAETISLEMSDEDLLKLSDDRCLALSLDELKTIKKYYQTLGRWPTDVELEILAQTWSEHCKHKIFAANINYSESNSHQYKKIENKKINSLYKSYVKKATKDVEQQRGIDWLISVFSDNAGIVRFDEKLDLCIKVETHNSPSALDPYGGALTGILGVNRDVLGTGMGARPIANTNVFCVGPYTWPRKGYNDHMPLGLMNPSEILTGVHKGVVDGGNKSGIPTVNGAMAFDPCFSGKPLVFCGTVGTLPPKLNSGRDSGKKYAQAGDHIIVVGGSVGADGIHGATFSSKELDESPPATAVQIGDPITQKRVGDFLMEARELEYYSSITDNGAGGLSSSVGEMAEATNGAKIDLSLCPLKYPGLSPWEVMISESQERMTLAVPKENVEKIIELANRRNVQIVDIGEFTDTGRFEIFWKDELVGDLTLEFMHDGLPPMNLEAVWEGPREINHWMPQEQKLNSVGVLESLKTVLADENIASKKYWVKQYDHEVQAATVIRPFVGAEQKTPNDSGVIALGVHGGEETNGVAISCGLAYQLSHDDPYIMAVTAVDEAVRNCVSQGANPEYICLLDNFCWPDPVVSQKNPDGRYKLGQLVRTCEGLYDVCVTYGMPLVSGKDSMKNDFKGRNRKGEKLEISIEPTLLVTAMAKIDIEDSVSSDVKNVDDLMYFINAQTGQYSLKNSVYSQYFNSEFDDLRTPDMAKNIEFYKKVFNYNRTHGLKSSHDVSEGGVLVSIVESLFSSLDDISFGIDLVDEKEDFYFSEGTGGFVVSINPNNREVFENTFTGQFNFLGELNSSGVIKIKDDSLCLEDLYTKWQGPWGEN
jgi:phosphoribosylformylglycinamidine synthase